MEKSPVAIIGAGLAGLSAAIRLQELGIPFRLYEQSSAPGGRVKTEFFRDFTLDVGFQVLLSSYPSLSKVVAVKDLHLEAFDSGALIHTEGAVERLLDPLRHPLAAVRNLNSSLWKWSDLTPLIRSYLRARFSAAQINDDTRSCEQELNRLGLSSKIIEGFLRPFFGGVFLDRSLSQPSSLFYELFGHFIRGKACLPKRGMQRLPELMAAKLPASSLLYERRLLSVSENSLRFEGDDTKDFSAVLLCCGAKQCAQLLGAELSAPADFFATRVHYFSAPKAPYKERLLFLDSRPGGKINSLCVPSGVQSSYAAAGRELISVTPWYDSSLKLDEEREVIQKELRFLFGTEVEQWEFLKSFEVGEALPKMEPKNKKQAEQYQRENSGIFFAGDNYSWPSIEGAISSGLEAAMTVEKHLRS